MSASIKTIAVIGTGVIGTGWIIRFLFNNKKIIVYDPQIKQRENLLKEIKRVKPLLNRVYKKKNKYIKTIKICRYT